VHDPTKYNITSTNPNSGLTTVLSGGPFTAAQVAGEGRRLALLGYCSDEWDEIPTPNKETETCA
jgi:hypothetical protein